MFRLFLPARCMGKPTQPLHRMCSMCRVPQHICQHDRIHFHCLVCHKLGRVGFPACGGTPHSTDGDNFVNICSTAQGDVGVSRPLWSFAHASVGTCMSPQTCTCLRRAWHEALGCPVWIDSHVYMSGFRTDLSTYHRVVAIHT